LTSAANHEISKSQSGLFIPNGICLKNSGGGFIQEGQLSRHCGINLQDSVIETSEGKGNIH
jgi:hypothetical protein